MRRAIEHPIRMLCANAGVEGAVVVGEVLAGKGNFGYNVATEKYEDLVKAGVVDPTKVTRTALQNAASIAAWCSRPRHGHGDPREADDAFGWGHARHDVDRAGSSRGQASARPLGIGPGVSWCSLPDRRGFDITAGPFVGDARDRSPTLIASSPNPRWRSRP